MQLDPVEEARLENKRDMERRVEAAAAVLRERYPMAPDNTCLSMTEKEFLAYIRRRRQEFEAR